jgi:hypothetical protein
MQIATKTEYIIALNHDEMILFKRIIELATAHCRLDISEEMEEFAMDILEHIRE